MGGEHRLPPMGRRARIAIASVAVALAGIAAAGGVAHSRGYVLRFSPFPSTETDDSSEPVGAEIATAVLERTLRADRLRPEWTATTTMREPPYRPVPTGVANVVVHVPPDFDADLPLHLVIYFHGAVQCAPLVANLGPVLCQPGGPRWLGYGLNARHDAAGTRSLYVTPQFAYMGGGSPGRMSERGYFTKFIEELVGETFAPGLGGKKTLADVESITLIGHSAGFDPVKAILDGRELEDKVRSVVMLDALFSGGHDAYARWLERASPEAPPRRFVYVYGPWGDTVGAGRLLVDRIRRKRPERVMVDPTGALNDAIRTHDLVMYASGVDHYWMPLIFIPKVLEGLDLPVRPVPMSRAAVGEVRPPQPLEVGQTISGRLGDDGTVLANDAAANDYVVALTANAPVVITTRGGRSETETCCQLDVYTQVFFEGREVAFDDDGAGGFDSRVAFTPSESGVYTVRVTSHALWRKRGPYTLRVDVAERRAL